MNELNASIQTEVANLAGRAQNDYLAAQQNQDSLHQSFENAKAEANKLNDSAVQYTILKHEAEANRDLYDGLQKKLKEAGVLASLRATNIVVVDPARPADRPARPIVPLNLAIGLFAGMLVGVGGAFVAENMDETISTPEDAETIAQVPSLGFVPRWKGRLGVSKPVSSTKALMAPGTGVLLVSRPHSQAAESYRSLRTSIMQSMRRGQSNVLLVSSALPEEGKTTTSINFAAAFAQQGAKVLLVEADMRRPTLCQQLNLSGPSGLSSLIAGEHPSDLPLKVPCIPKLSVIPAGPRPQYPAELLGSPRMEALLTQWRTEYDYIIVDTPPVLSVTDAAVLAPYCDAAIVVVRSGVTSKKSLQRVGEIFRRTQTRIMGTVLNAFDVKSADYRSYAGYETNSKNGNGYYIAEAN
jgi:capsular exopolysaccharide synthesis family protein